MVEEKYLLTDLIHNGHFYWETEKSALLRNWSPTCAIGELKREFRGEVGWWRWGDEDCGIVCSSASICCCWSGLGLERFLAWNIVDGYGADTSKQLDNSAKSQGQLPRLHAWKWGQIIAKSPLMNVRRMITERKGVRERRNAGRLEERIKPLTRPFGDRFSRQSPTTWVSLILRHILHPQPIGGTFNISSSR